MSKFSALARFLRVISNSLHQYSPKKTPVYLESVYKGIMESPMLTTIRYLSLPRTHLFQEISSSV